MLVNGYITYIPVFGENFSTLESMIDCVALRLNPNSSKFCRIGILIQARVTYKVALVLVILVVMSHLFGVTLVEIFTL